MLKDKGPEQNHVTVIADGGDKGIVYTTMRCLYCNKTHSGRANRIRAHLTGGDTSISNCDKVPEDVYE